MTPNLDRLAGEGVVFELAFSPAPQTLPSHATLLTGLDPTRHGVRLNSIYDLPDAAATLAETLRDAGWRTRAVVASVVLLARHGLDQGFDDYDQSGLALESGPRVERTADAVADAALRALAGSEPFLAFVHFYDPHRPYRAPPAIEARFGDPYVAEVHFADRELGRLLDALSADGRLDRTIVIVTADHGEGRGEHGETTHGMLVHDATQRVPLIVRAPGIAPRRAGDVLATLADVTPTVLDLCGVPPPAGIDGRSLAPALRGEPMEPGDAWLESRYPLDSFDFAPLAGVRTREWKLAIGARPHLWNVAEDPGELEDLAARRPEVVTALARRLEHLERGRGEPLPADERRLTADEMKVLGGLGYVASAPAGDDADRARPDPYDEIAGAEAISQASLLAAEGSLEEAVARLEPLARAYPGCAHVRLELGALHGRLGRPGEALPHLLAAAALRPLAPQIHLQVALAAYQSGRQDLVRPHLESAVAIEGCPARAFLLLADVSMAAGDRRAALATLESLLERDDLSPEERREALDLQARLRG